MAVDVSLSLPNPEFMATDLIDVDACHREFLRSRRFSNWWSVALIGGQHWFHSMQRHHGWFSACTEFDKSMNSLLWQFVPLMKVVASISAWLVLTHTTGVLTFTFLAVMENPNSSNSRKHRASFGLGRGGYARGRPTKLSSVIGKTSSQKVDSILDVQVGIQVLTSN